MECNCESCGANLAYEPGSTHLSCDYCGHRMDFSGPESDSDSTKTAHQELDLDAYLSKVETEEPGFKQSYVNCGDCGAKTQLQNSRVAGNCAFCDAPLVADRAADESLIKPAGLLPFALAMDAAQEQAHKWIAKRWFAPSDFKNLLNSKQRFKGVYLPFWTYDCSTSSHYVGQRGRHYYESVSSNKGTKRVRKTRWRTVSGRVSLAFDDVLVPATKSLPKKKLHALEPWDLVELKDYRDEYLLGYVAEAYQVGLKEGYAQAKQIMDDRIRRCVKGDIGGDEQRILSVTTGYEDAKFKHLLLPVWTAPYRYKGKVYQLLVNARTGEVQGERPWSWVKITLVILAVLTLVAAGVYLFGGDARAAT